MKHVLSEANRVLMFKQVCDSNTHDRLETLGDLMNQSHTSCSKLYECSSEQLDELTDICRSVISRFYSTQLICYCPVFFFRDSGALGSRLTGAGWGGCAVSLVRQEHLENFIKNVREKFYINSNNSNRIAKADQSIFATLPACGVYAVRL